ncbi:hypothetical protein PDN58_18440 [Bacillus cereus]|uniref:hypothetical protein n=1 Tax=Bacillus cereus TaxID=1396 RepID=UPI00159630B5|nr:hypothetical protein [Bacillus cereus]MDA2039387.1 hypothetical protein [Bacillus cereus]
MKKACQIKYYKIEGKMKYPLIYFFNSFIKSIELGAVLFITLALLQQLKILNLKWIENVLKHLPHVNQELNRQFLFSQISVTFIILSLFSLIINLKKEKVLGTSIYQIVFARSILGNIKFISLSVFFFLFINITLYINDSSSSAILYVFLITLSLLTLLIIKIIFYSNSQKLSTNKIVSIYNRENTKLVHKPRIVWKSGVHFSEYLYNLNEDTIEKILRGDAEYKRNLYVYEKIANLSLVNYYNNNSIYFACLIVASKLATLYLQIKDNDKSNRKIVEGYLLLVLSKLFEVDNQKIKYYCYVIKQTMHDNRIYGEVYFTQENMKLLSVIKQTIMIRKNRVDIKNTSFSNWRLREIVNLFSTRYNSNLLKKEQEKANREVIDKFGVLIHLL